MPGPVSAVVREVHGVYQQRRHIPRGIEEGAGGERIVPAGRRNQLTIKNIGNMEEKKNLVRDIMDMVNGNSKDGIAEGTACIVLAKDGEDVMSYYDGTAAHLGMLLIKFLALAEQKEIGRIMPYVCAMYLYSDEWNAAFVESLLKDDGKELRRYLSSMITIVEKGESKG